MTRTHDDMRENALAWLDGDAAFPRETAVNEQHLALDVIDLLSDLTRLTSALAEAERGRDEAWAASDHLAIRLDDSAKRNIALHDEIDSLRAQVADLTRERDEARDAHTAQLAQLRIQRDLAHYQRDKARAHVAELSDLASLALDPRDPNSESRARRVLAIRREEEL